MSKQQNKICLLIDSKTYGGIETHICHLAKGLVENGYQVHLVLITNHGIHPIFDGDSLISSFTFRPTGGLFSLFQLLKNLDNDVIHTHGYKAGILGRIYGVINNVAVVSTFHAGEKGNAKMRFYGWLDRLTAWRTYCLCVSEQIAQSLGRRAKVMENFVEIPQHVNQSVEQVKKIAFVGRFSIEKGPDLFSIMANKLPEHCFVMYGDGPMYDQIEQTKSENLQLFGNVNSMNEHWQNIKILCITSREEGLPLVALEALARGIPIISYDVGGLSTVVHNDLTGWLILSGDEQQFISKIEFACCLSKTIHLRMATYSQQLIKSKFSSQAIIPKICQCYNAALKTDGYA